MSAVGTLQLFPPPPSKSNSVRRNGSRRKLHKTARPPPLSEKAKSSDTKEIVIHVSEKAVRSSVLSTDRDDGSDVRPGPDVDRASHQPPRSEAASPTTTQARSTVSGSATLVRSPSNTSSAAPIRSMFPQYDASVPLSEQDYRPTQSSPGHISPQAISKQPYSPHQWSPRGGARASYGQAAGSAKFLPSPVTSPFTVSFFPNGSLGPPRPHYTSAEELPELWEAANGQDVKDKAKTFALQMHREGTFDARTKVFRPTENECFSFGLSASEPFFDMQTLRASSVDAGFSECNVRRRDPRTGAVIPVMTFDLPAATSSPPDGLVTSLYPKIAAMMALDRAQSTSSGATQAAPDERTASVLADAAARETYQLWWDSDSRHYYLLHPKVYGRAERRFIIIVDGAAGFDVHGARGTIRIAECDTQHAFVALELGTSTLLIDTRATSTVASLYTIDVCVSAVFAVALLEGRRLRHSQGKRISRPLLSPPPISVSGGRSCVAEESVGMARPEPEASVPESAEGILGVISVGFQFVIWVLSALFGGLAALVVAISASMNKRE